MIQSLGSFTPILIASFFLTMNQGLMGSILSVRLAQMDASAQVAGLMTTAYFAGHMFGSQLGHRLLGRIGHIRGFVTVMAIAACSTLIIPVVPEPWAWIAIRFAIGTSLVLAFLVLESWLNMTATNTERGSVFGAYITIVYIGMTAGQAMLGFLDPQAFHAFSIAAVCLMLGLLPMTTTRLAQPVLPPETRVKLMDLYRMSPVGIAACVISGALTGAIFGLFPFFAAGLGLDTGRIALFMSVVIGGGLVLNWPLGRLSDRVDRRWIITAAALMITASSALLGLSDGQLSLLVPAGAILGGATSVLYSLGVAHTNDNAGGIDAVEVGAGLLLAFGVGAILGPPLASMMMDVLLPSALFGFTGVTGLALAGLAVARIAVRQPVLAADKIDFVARSSAAVSSVTTEAAATADAASAHDDTIETVHLAVAGLPITDVERSTSAIAQSA